MQNEVLSVLRGENGGESGMKLYIKMIKPILSVPTSSQDYTPKHIPVESEDTWYQEEERESLIKKYKHLETTFERLVFEEQYKEFEIVLCKDCKHLFEGEHTDSCCDVLTGKAGWLKTISVSPYWFCADGERR